MSLTYSFSLEAMNALANSNATSQSVPPTMATSTPDLTTPQYMPIDDPDSHFRDTDSDSYDTIDLTNDNDHDIPPRPGSRLDFCDASPLAMSLPSLEPAKKSKSKSGRHSRSPSGSSTLKWTKSLLKKMSRSKVDSEDFLGGNAKTNKDTSVNHVECDPAHGVATNSIAGAYGDDDTLPSATPINLPLSSSSSSTSLDNISVTLSSSSSGSSHSDSDSDLSDSDCDSDDFDLDSLSLSDMGMEDIDPREPHATPSHNTSLTSIAALSFSGCSRTSADTPTTPLLPPLLCSSEDSEPCLSVSQIKETASLSFSCLPSPLSPSYSKPPTPPFMPSRHDYDHHGHSRHSFRHTKWFWSFREEAWAEYAAYLGSTDDADAKKAYAGIKTSPELEPQPSLVEDFEEREKRFPNLFSSARKMMPNSRRSWTEVDGSQFGSVSAVDADVVPEATCDDGSSSPTLLPSCSSPEDIPLPPMTCHPRWGDLQILRDAWCVHMDRYFVGMPLWSIRKALWMFDVHSAYSQSASATCDSGFAHGEDESPKPSLSRASSSTRNGDDDETEQEEDGIDSCESSEAGDSDCYDSMRMSMLTGFSDDSDVTLVESDEEDGHAHDEEEEPTLAMGAASSTSGDFEGEEEFFEDISLSSPLDSSHSPESSCSTSPSSSTHTTPTLSGMSSSSSSSLYYACASTSSSSKSLYHQDKASVETCFVSEQQRSPPQVHPSYMPLPSNSPSSNPKSLKARGKRRRQSNASYSSCWETTSSWYKRSEVLLMLTRRDRERELMREVEEMERKRALSCWSRDENEEEKRVGLGISVAIEDDLDPVTIALATAAATSRKTICA